MLAIAVRLAQEIAESLKQSHDYEATATELAHIPVLLKNWQESQTDMLALWEELVQHGHLPERYYRASIAELRESNPELLPEAIIAIYQLLRARSDFDLPTELLSELLPELLVWAEKHADTKRSMQAQEGLSYLSYVGRRYDDSQRHAEESLRLAEAIGDKPAQEQAHRALGYAFLRLRRFEAAKHSFEQQYQLAETIGDRSAMANALGNSASVLIDEEKHREAEVVCHKQISLAESIGDTMGIVYARMNLGIIFAEYRRYDDSIETLEIALELAKSVGNRKQAGIILGNLGNYMVKLRRPEEGYPMLLTALETHREMGFPQGMTYWLNSLAEMYCEAAFGAGYPPGFLIDFVDMAPGEDWRKAVRRMAWNYAEEGHRLSRELNKYDTSYASVVVLARVEAAEGKKTSARDRLKEALTTLTDTLRISDCYVWLWRLNLGSEEEIEGYRRSALALEEEIYKNSPRPDLLAEIEELRRGEIASDAR